MKYGDLKVGDIVVTECGVNYYHKCTGCKKIYLYETKKVLKTVVRLKIIFNSCLLGNLPGFELAFSKHKHENITDLVGII